MDNIKTFPQQREGRYYLSEGGTETELMYKYGFELPEFAMFPLLDNPDAVAKMSDMFRSYLDVVAKHGMCALMGGLDYRASPDWGELLGYSPKSLADANHQSIEFLREIANEYTFDIPESVGVARAAVKIGVPLAISLSLNSTSKLNSGPSLAEAITMIDEATNQSAEFYSINCSHPVEYGPAIESGEWINRLRGVRPNASKMEKIALCQIGHLEEGNPVELGELWGDLSQRYPHMDIWGGCCGIWDTHLDEIAKNISGR